MSSARRRSSWRAHGSAPGLGGPAPGGAKLSLRPPWRKSSGSGARSATASCCPALPQAPASSGRPVMGVRELWSSTPAAILGLHRRRALTLRACLSTLPMALLTGETTFFVYRGLRAASLAEPAGQNSILPHATSKARAAKTCSANSSCRSYRHRTRALSTLVPLNAE